jgi:hypothetical protein
MFLSWVRRLGALGLALPRRFWALVTVGWAGLIWFLSTHEGSTGEGGLFMSWLGNLAHAPLFGLLGLWLALAGPRVEPGDAAGASPRRWARLALVDQRLVLVAVVVWGFLDELHQSFVPGRDASVFDLVTDGVGVLSVLAVAAAAGSAATTERGMRLRLGVAFVACSLAGLVAAQGWA